MKSAIITGANGFIGKVLTKKLLEQKYVVYAIVTNLDDMKDFTDSNLICIKAFYEDYDELLNKLPKNIDLFYHFAWQGVFGDAFKDYHLQLKNVSYVGDAVMIAIKLGVKKFVLASTVNTLETKRYLNLQSFKPRYTNIYSTSKLAAEMIGKTLAFNHGMEFNCGIIGMVYGEKNYSKMIPNIVISNLIYNRETNLINGDTPYDIIYVDDVCDAFIAIGERGISLKTYYVGHSNISTFESIWNKVREIINPNGVLNFGYYNETNAIDFSLINPNELYEDTGFIPKTDFNESILKTAQWVRESGVFK